MARWLDTPPREDWSRRIVDHPAAAAALPPQDFDLSRADLPTRLADVDLERELVQQAATLKLLQARVISDDAIPANQRAQVANALSQSLANLVKVQGDVYTSERLKRMEALLVEQIKTLPQPQQEDFLASYERALQTLD